MALQSIRPRGIFHARESRDAEALRRNGQTYVLVNELPNRDGSASLEIMFEDGCWMLASPGDLE